MEVESPQQVHLDHQMGDRHKKFPLQPKEIHITFYVAQASTNNL